MRRALLLVLAASALLAAACSSGGDAGTATTAAPTTAEPATTAGEPGTTAAPDGSASTTVGGGSSVDLSQALLQAEEVGEGFVAVPADEDDPDELTPCGTPSVQVLVPAVARDAVDLVNQERNLFLSQEVFAYEDQAAAERALAAGHEGLACGSGTSESDGSTIEFDLNEVQPPPGLGDAAFAYQGTVTAAGQTVNTIFVAIQDGRAVSTLSFLAAGDDPGPPVEPILSIAASRLASVA